MNAISRCKCIGYDPSVQTMRSTQLLLSKYQMLWDQLQVHLVTFNHLRYELVLFNISPPRISPLTKTSHSIIYNASHHSTWCSHAMLKSHAFKSCFRVRHFQKGKRLVSDLLHRILLIKMTKPEKRHHEIIKFTSKVFNAINE